MQENWSHIIMEVEELLIKTNIAKITEEVDAKARYDAAVKKVLSDPQILAWILQYTVKEFKEYNHLQKVYSIWICMQAPLNSEYTITDYHICREEVYGHMTSRSNQRYDLMEMVMVCLGRPENATKGTRLHRLLTTVLSKELTAKEKQNIMKDDYEIVTTVELEGELVKMCNLSEYIEEKGIEKGIEKGLSALVNSLKDYVQGEALYQSVIKNEVYKNISREEVFKYLNV